MKTRQLDRTGPVGRVPPHDLEAEKAVLSAILLDNQAIHTVVTEVRAEDFYHPSHQSIYRTMVRLREDNQPVDLHTLSDRLKGENLLEAVGGALALAELSDYEATAANVLHHARIVRDKAVKRSVISVATEIVEMGFEESDAAAELLDHAESRILEVGQESSRTDFKSLETEMHEAVDFIEAIMERGGRLTGLPTGFVDLDKKTGGLQPGELIILAARPSMGKTAFALNLARNASVKSGKKVAIFSLEMTRRSLALRLISSEARYNSSAFRTGFIPKADHSRLMKAAGDLSSAPIWIDDTPAPSILEIKAKARRLQAEKGLDLVIIDYLQLARGDSNAERREQEISEISRGLKSLAKELDIPVLALSQLNRGPESRPNKRPMLSDLRESGAIEQDADVIAFIYRDVVYNEGADQEDAELIISKQRNGPIGTLSLNFEAGYALFTSRSGASDEGGGASRAPSFVGPEGAFPDEEPPF